MDMEETQGYKMIPPPPHAVPQPAYNCLHYLADISAWQKMQPLLMENHRHLMQSLLEAANILLPSRKGIPFD